MMDWDQAKRWAWALHGGVFILSMLMVWLHRPVIQPHSVIWLQASAPKAYQTKQIPPKALDHPVAEAQVVKPKVDPQPKKVMAVKHPMVVPRKQKAQPQTKKIAVKKVLQKSNPKPIANQHAFHRKTVSALEQALALEDQAMKQAEVTDAVIAKYQDKIRQAIAQHWRIPVGTQPEQVCELSLTLDATGRVLAVSLVKSSGLAALDQAAIAAVWHASPLPIPLAMAKTFEHLDLTLHPESVW
jgi:TonB family protein